MAEILFGIPLRDTGIKRYPLRHRQRIIQFAITLFYKDFDKGCVGNNILSGKYIYLLFFQVC